MVCGTSQGGCPQQPGVRHSDASVGTEELAHVEMIGAIVYQLTRCLTPEEIKKSGFDAYFVDHTTGIYPQAASGTPFSAATLQSTGDAIADLFEDMAADAAIAQEQTFTEKIRSKIPMDFNRNFLCIRVFFANQNIIYEHFHGFTV
ncbi:MAG: manganese catalase family protein [Clostridia bacterium]|nr:manganese catalase family protein [Clostridia bacterium]